MVYSFLSFFHNSFFIIQIIQKKKNLIFYKGEWDCVCTCFFIDTAKNIVEYIEVISNILKPGGIWINLGTNKKIKKKLNYIIS